MLEPIIGLGVRAAGLLNRAGPLNGRPFANDIAMTPRLRDRWFSWTHYGVMVPGLAEPHRFFNVMAILGTPGALCFDNDHAMASSPRDTAYVVSTTAVPSERAFRAYAMGAECELRADGSRLDFAGDLVIEGAYPGYRLQRELGDVAVELEIELTDRVSHFVHVPRVYDHWSLLGHCRGAIHGPNRRRQDVDALCTFEYARGAGLYTVPAGPLPRLFKIPLTSFTYQVLNVGPEDQLLLSEVGRPGAIAHRGAWERGLNDPGRKHDRAVMTLVEQRAEPAVTPDGRLMPLPAVWTWEVLDADGALVTELECRANDDWVYGLGAGFVGSFEYAGRHRDRDAGGTGYAEHILTA